MGTLLQAASNQAAHVAGDLQAMNREKLDLTALIQRVDQADRDIAAVKTLLKRERLRKA